MRRRNRLVLASALCALVTAGAATVACTQIVVGDLPLSTDDGGGGANDASLSEGGITTGDATSDALADAGPGADAGDGSMTYPFATAAISIAPLPELLVTGADLRFGEGLAFSPSSTSDYWLAIGAPGATGAGDIDDHGAVQMVHVTIDPGNTVTLAASLLDTSIELNDGELGHAVAFSPDGKLLAVGAPRDVHASGDTSRFGTVFLYTLNTDGLGWTYAQSVWDDTVPTLFGSAVAVADNSSKQAPGVSNLLLVGAPGDVEAGAAGEAMLYYLPMVLTADAGRSATSDYLMSQSPGDGMGTAVAANSNATVMIVGAPFPAGQGAAYLVEFGALMSPHDIDLASSSGSQHGASVAITPSPVPLADIVAIGAPLDSLAGRVNLRSVTYDNDVPMFAEAGAQDTVGPPASVAAAGFGTSVAVSSDRLYVGEPGAPPAGAVAVFMLDTSGNPLTSATQVTPTSTPGARVGSTVAVAPDELFYAASAPSPGNPQGAAVYLLH